MREERTPTVEGMGVIETGLEEGNREEEGELVVEISESEEDRVQQVSETETQILNASCLRRKFLMEELEKEVEPPVQRVETQAGGASLRKRRNLAEEPKEEKEDDEEVVLRTQPEALSQESPAQQPTPVAELERKRKGKQPELPPKKKFRAAASSVRIEEWKTEQVATQATDSKDDAVHKETRSKAREDFAPPIYPVMQIIINRHSLANMLKYEDARLEEECKKRVMATKQLKSGKKLHLPSLERLEVQKEFA